MDPFVLDAVIEGVPSPRSGKVDAVWPRSLADLWKPVEVSLTRPSEEESEARGPDVRRVWRIRDPESDLDVTVIWVPGPGDPEEADADDGEEEGEPTTGELGGEASEGDAAHESEADESDAGSEGETPDLGAAAPEEGTGDEPAQGESSIDGGDAEGGDGESEDEDDGSPAPEGGLLFGHTPRPGTRSEDLLRVCELALRMAEQLGLKLFDPVLGETFETEDWAYRLTEPFHARGYLATHWVRGDDERVSWVHTHGMDRFGLPDVEAFDVPEQDGHEVVAFLHEAALSWIRDEAPAVSPTPRRIDGVRVRVQDAQGARERAKGYGPEAWSDHDSPYLTLQPAGSWSLALSGWRPSSVRRPPRLVERLCAITSEILPAVRTRFERDGAAVKVKARFPVATAPEKGSPGFESMWVHVEEWDDGKIRGRLANDPEIRVDLSCGAAVDVNPEEVWDVLVVNKDGQPYRGVSLRRWLRQ